MVAEQLGLRETPTEESLLSLVSWVLVDWASMGYRPCLLPSETSMSRSAAQCGVDKGVNAE